jgi:hypothetical protein
VPSENDPLPMFPGRSLLTAGALTTALFCFNGAAQSAESAYTDLDMDACTVVKEYEEGGGVDLECPGYGDVPVFLTEGDLRFDADFGVKNEYWQSYGPFNHPHDVIEWRLHDGLPFATILRFHLDTGMTGTDADRTQVLLVSKVGTESEPGCAIGSVDAAVEQANGVARGVAANAAQFECGTDSPVAVGGPESMARALSGSVFEGEIPE